MKTDPAQDALAERIRQNLASHPDVREKRMFGGVAFMDWWIAVGRTSRNS